MRDQGLYRGLEHPFSCRSMPLNRDILSPPFISGLKSPFENTASTPASAVHCILQFHENRTWIKAYVSSIPLTPMFMGIIIDIAKKKTSTLNDSVDLYYNNCIKEKKTLELVCHFWFVVVVDSKVLLHFLLCIWVNLFQLTLANSITYISDIVKLIAFPGFFFSRIVVIFFLLKPNTYKKVFALFRKNKRFQNYIEQQVKFHEE